MHPRDSSGSPATTTVGGTSAVAPLLTAGFTGMAAVRGKRLGRIQAAAYALATRGSSFRDITQGDNAYPAGTSGNSAGPGFDVPSGWGSPIFTRLATAPPSPEPVSAGTRAGA